MPRLPVLLYRWGWRSAPAAGFAQTPAVAPAAERKASGPGSRAAPVISPEIMADRQVTFRLRAPNAKAVTLSGQFTRGTTTMSKDDLDCGA